MYDGGVDRQYILATSLIQVCIVSPFSRIWINRGMVANPARGHLSSLAHENMVSQDRFGHPVPRQSSQFPHSD